MKIRHRFLSLLVLPLLLSSCTFADYFRFKISSISVEDKTEQYALGDVFAERCDLTISAKYNNGKTKEYTLAQVDSSSLTYVNNGEKVEQNIEQPFAVSGEYSFTVTIEEVVSSELKFTVIEQHVYVESLTITGEHEMEYKTSMSLTVQANPSNYTVSILYSVDSNIVTLTKTATGVDVYAVKPGDVVLTAKALRNETEYVTTTFNISITSTAQLVKMAQNYYDFNDNNLYSNLQTCPVSGQPKLLVIPVWFTDSTEFITTSAKEVIREDIGKAYFGSETETGWQSVKSYYYEESFGKLDIVGTLSEWYNASISYKTAGRQDYDTGALVNKAVNWYFTNNKSESKSDYDTNEDGFLDGVMLIYAAPDSRNNGFSSYPNLWAYCSWLGTGGSGVRTNVYFWASYDFMYSRATSLLKTGKTDYTGGDTSHCLVDAHTYIHEMGHVLGLNDYYDYNSTKENPRCPAGGFSMQDYNVGGHDAFSVLAYGWADAYVPTESCQIIISEFTKTHDLILLTPEFNSYNSPFDEYLLLELYSPTKLNELDSKHTYNGGYPTGPNKVGIRLWHVDARLATLNSTGQVILSNSANVKQPNGVYTAMSNTHYVEGETESNKQTSILGSDYYDYKLLQLIRNSTTETYNAENPMGGSDLFYAGDVFTMNTYKKQFVRSTKLNSGVDLGWSFTINKIEKVDGVSSATITLTRA